MIKNIFINGAMGVGKSTLISKLAEKGFNVSGELRAFPTSVDLYYKQPQKYAFLVHMDFIIKRIELEIKNNDGVERIYDKHVYDLFVYSEYSYLKGWINKTELDTLYYMITSHADDLLPTGFIYVIDIDEELLLQQLHNRGRDFEVTEDGLAMCIDFAKYYCDLFIKAMERINFNKYTIVKHTSLDVEENCKLFLKIINEEKIK